MTYFQTVSQAKHSVLHSVVCTESATKGYITVNSQGLIFSFNFQTNTLWLFTSRRWDSVMFTHPIENTKIWNNTSDRWTEILCLTVRLSHMAHFSVLNEFKIKDHDQSTPRHSMQVATQTAILDSCRCWFMKRWRTTHPGSSQEHHLCETQLLFSWSQPRIDSTRTIPHDKSWWWFSPHERWISHCRRTCGNRKDNKDWQDKSLLW